MIDPCTRYISPLGHDAWSGRFPEPNAAGTYPLAEMLSFGLSDHSLTPRVSYASFQYALEISARSVTIDLKELTMPQLIDIERLPFSRHGSYLAIARCTDGYSTPEAAEHPSEKIAAMCGAFRENGGTGYAD